jgi:hypothetical protein
MIKKQLDYDNAWLNAWQSKSCPTDEILFGPLTTELKDHLVICSICKLNRQKMDVDSLNDLAISLRGVISNKAETPHMVGQLWSINQKLSDWGAKGRYYSVPIVLILEMDQDNNKCLVSQIHDDTNFIGPGDIALPPLPNLYAESWNTYTLSLDALKQYWGEVVSSVAEKVKKEENHHIEERSAINLFRQLEIETGLFFSSQTVAGEKDISGDVTDKKVATKILKFRKSPPEQRIKTLLNENSFTIDNSAADNTILLFNSRIDEPLRLAAADDTLYIHGPLLTANDHGDDAVVIVHGQVEIDYQTNELQIEGLFDSIPDGIVIDHVEFGWLCHNGEIIRPHMYEFYADDSSFDLKFTNVPNPEGELRFFVIDSSFLDDEA